MNYLIESDRLWLRKFKSTDARDYYRMTRDYAIKRFVPLANVSSLDAVQKSIDLYYAHCDCEEDFYLIIEHKETHCIVGAIFAFGLSTPHTFEMNIFINRKHRKKGYMTEALLAFISFLPPNSELLFVVDKKNKASLNTVSKLPGAKIKPLTTPQKDFMTQFSITV